ncbi:MAG: acyltransferase [Gemmatimonadales bacterium]
MTAAPKEVVLNEKHIAPLDGLRGLAVLMVLFDHFWLVQKPVSALQNGVYTFVQNGWIGVDLFFVLSGFLITGILLDAKGSTHYFRNFYARRILRIFPLYWGFLFAYFVIAPTLLHLDPASPYRIPLDIKLWFWTYTSNLLALFHDVTIPPGTNHFWTLAVEEQFYMFWPAVVFLLSPKSLEKTCLWLVVFALGVRLFLFTTPFHHTGGFALTPARIDTLAIGAWLAVIYRDPARRQSVERLAPRAFVLALVLLIVVNLPSVRLAGYSVAMQTFGFPLLAVMAASAISMGTGSEPGNAKLRNALTFQPLLAAGKYSYAMYVFHLPLVIALDVAGLHMRTFSGGRPPGMAAALAYSIICSLLTFLAAFASWHLYEKHFLKLKRLFPRREPVFKLGSQPSAVSR